MSPVRSISSHARPQPSPGNALGARARYWVRRYWVQDLAAALALAACALALSSWPTRWLGPAAALAELATFYGVAFARHLREFRGPRRGRTTVLRMLTEYGPAEGIDLVLRPVLMTLFASGFETGLDWAPALGLFAGSLVADVLFYLAAAWSHAQTAKAS